MPQDNHYFQVDRVELPLEPHHLGIPLGVYKTIFESMVCLVQTVHLTPTLTPSPNGLMQDST
jgi:hypothetical protein